METKAVYANSRDSLTANSLGLFHDRCYHLFAGKMKNVPMEYKELIKEEYLYILIYQEENIKYYGHIRKTKNLNRKNRR